MPTKLQKLGNSLGVRLPKKIIAQLGLKEGSPVLVRHEGVQVIVERAVAVGKPLTKDDWQRFVLPMEGPHENISGSIDAILYGAPPR